VIRPYPKGPEELIDNARDSFLRWTLAETENPSPPRKGSIFEALKTGHYRVEILKVENWGANRCASMEPHASFYLVRFFDPETGHYKLDKTSPEISSGAHQMEQRRDWRRNRTNFVQPTISLGAEWGTVGLVGGTP
jgi:hypothetical protein